MQMLRQFVEKISWGELDYMIIDLPPGTSDEPISIAQALKPDGVVIVTTPYDLALMDAERAASMARAMDVPILGIVENMSGLVCPRCGKEVETFKSGGGGRAAERLGVPLLGRIEIDREICMAGDKGRPFILNSGTRTAKAFEEIVSRIIGHYEGENSWA
jgi:Mrp family chromosome partitioning ATPase